jgi:hypothetical protein
MWTWWLRGKEAVDAFYLEFIIKKYGSSFKFGN